VGGGSLNYNSPFKTYLNFRNSLFLLYKNLPDNKLHAVLFFRLLLDGLAALRFLFKLDFKSIKAVWDAHMDYYKNLKELRLKRKNVKSLEITKTPRYILNKSIVFEFYIKGNKTYDSLTREN
jgi:hypothetical protein